MATYRQRVHKLASEIGASVEIDKTDYNFCVRVEAPINNHWDDGLHEIVESQNAGFNTSELWKDVLERMSEGVEPCNDECEWWD